MIRLRAGNPSILSTVLSLFLCLRLFRIFFAFFSKVSEVVTIYSKYQ